MSRSVIQIRIDPLLKAKIEKIAHKRGVSVSQLIKEYLEMLAA